MRRLPRRADKILTCKRQSHPCKPPALKAAESSGASAGKGKPGEKPVVSYWHLWTDGECVSHQKQCALTSMDGTRIEQGPGEFSIGEDQGCTKGADGRKGHRSGTIGDQPAVLMTVQLHTDPQHEPCHIC